MYSRSFAWSWFILAAVGAAAFLLGTLASYWMATGTTPPFAFFPDYPLTGRQRISGIPIEYIGFVWLVFVAAGFARRRSLAEPLSAWVAVTALPLAAYYLSVAWQKPGWPLWTGLASVTAILAFSSAVTPLKSLLSGLWRELRDVVRDPSSRTILAVSAGSCLVVAALMQYSMESASPKAAAEADLRRWYSSKSRAYRSEHPGAVSVEAFTDYQCPFCASTVPAGKLLVDGFYKSTNRPGQLVVLDFPLDDTCNQKVDSIHPLACDLAAAVKLVGLIQGDTPMAEFSATLYRKLKDMNAEALKKELALIGLAEDFERRHDELRQLVSQDVRRGIAHGVRATPTFVVNGVALPLGLDALRVVLEYEREAQ